MEAEWENVKDQEMEPAEEEKADFCSKDPLTTPSAGVRNMVIKPYTIKETSSKSEALQAFHERKRLDNFTAKEFSRQSPPPLQAPMECPQSALDASSTMEKEEEMMEISISPLPWLDSPFSEAGEGGDGDDEEVETIMKRKYAAEGFLHSDSNDNVVGDSSKEVKSATTTPSENEEQTIVEEVVDEKAITKDNTKTSIVEEGKSCEASKESDAIPAITTSWRKAIDSDEWIEVGFKSDLTGYKLKSFGGYVKIKEGHHFLENQAKMSEVSVDMRNVRKQLGIENWDLDVPMVVENRTKESHPLQCSHTCPWSGKRCQAAFREKEEKLYQHHSSFTCPYRGRSDDRLNPGNRLQERWDPELECSRCRVKVISSQLESHWDSCHRLLPCPACSQFLQTVDDVTDHLKYDHGTHFMAAPALPLPTWKSAYMAVERRPPTPKLPSQPPSPDSSPCPSPVMDFEEQNPSFAPIERASDHRYTSGFIANPRPLRPLAPKQHSGETKYLAKTNFMKGTQGPPAESRTFVRAPPPSSILRQKLTYPLPRNTAPQPVNMNNAPPRVGQQLYPGAMLAAIGPKVVTVKGQDGKVAQQISLKPGQGLVQMVANNKTVLKVVDVPTSHQQNLNIGAQVVANNRSTQSTSKPLQPNVVSLGTVSNLKLAQLQANFPAHMLPKVSSSTGQQTQQRQPPLIVNSNGVSRRGFPTSSPATVPKNQSDFSPKPSPAETTTRPPVTSSIPSWAPGGSKPLIKQVKASNGQLVWAQAISIEKIPGSNSANFKFKAIGPVDPKNPNTPPSPLKMLSTQPNKVPVIQSSPKQMQGPYLCPFANCSMTFKTLQEMDIHGNLHGANGEKAYCPHCKIGYNRWGNLFNHVFKGAGCTQQGLAALPGPFLCPACAEESPNASALRLHCETKHTNTTPTCPGCGTTYNRWGNLLNHVFGPSACPLATPRPQTKCSGCETELGNLHSLHQHLLNQQCTVAVLQLQSLGSQRAPYRCEWRGKDRQCCGICFSSGPELSFHISTVHESRTGVARRNQVASAYVTETIDANTRTTLMRNVANPRLPIGSALKTYPGFKPRKVSSIQPSSLLMNDTQEEGVDPLEEIDPYPGDEEVKEVDPLADPLGGVSPPRIEESSSSHMGAVILG